MQNAGTVRGVTYYLNSNRAKFLHKLCGRFTTFCKTSTANLRFLWRHLQTELWNV